MSIDNLKIDYSLHPQKGIRVKNPNIAHEFKRQTKIELKTKYNCKEPLTSSAKMQVTFKGSLSSQRILPLAQQVMQFLKEEIFRLEPNIREIEPDKIKEAFDLLTAVSPKIAEDFRELVTEKFPGIFKGNRLDNIGIDDDELKALLIIKEKFGQTISNSDYTDLINGAYFKLPRKTFTSRVIEALISPITGTISLFKKTVEFVKDLPKLISVYKENIVSWITRKPKKERVPKIESEAENVKKEILTVYSKYSDFCGFLDSIDAWKRVHRKRYNSEITAKSLQSKILRRLPKKFDEQKAQYSTAQLATWNRLVSGSLAAYFLSTDNYNMTRLINDDKKEATREQVTRAGQEGVRIGLETYMNTVAFSMFEDSINRSLNMALGTGMSVVALSNILGRKLLNRPILPVTKEQAQNMSQREENNGFAAKLGKILSGTKIKSTPKKVEISNNSASNSLPNSRSLELLRKPAFSSKHQQTVSFTGVQQVTNRGLGIITGYYKSLTRPAFFSKQEVIDLLAHIQNVDPQLAQAYEDIINKSLGDKLLRSIEGNPQIAIGTKNLFSKAIIDSVFSPIFFIRDFGNGLAKACKSIFTSNDTLFAQQEKLLQQKDLYSQFQAELLENKGFADLKKGQQIRSKIKLAARILDEAKDRASEEIQGIQHIFNAIKKELKDFTGDSKAKLEKISNLIKEKIYNGLGFKGTDYDNSVFSIANVNLARIVTAAFLASDAYNLAMEHSKGDLDLSTQKAKQRLIQEACRIIFSAYIIKLTGNLTKKWQNRWLLAALGVTTVNVMINETLARMSVGQPITPKTRAELIELERKVQNSKNPIVKFIGKIMGKKSLAVQAGIATPSDKPESTVKTESKDKSVILQMQVMNNNHDVFKDFSLLSLKRK